MFIQSLHLRAIHGVDCFRRGRWFDHTESNRASEIAGPMLSGQVGRGFNSRRFATAWCFYLKSQQFVAYYIDKSEMRI